MFNYSEITLNETTMAMVTKFNDEVKAYATESVEHTTARKALEEKKDALIKLDDNDTTSELITNGTKSDTLKAIQGQLDSINDKWKVRTQRFNLALFGGKVDGNKVDGICSFITDDLYKAYINYVTNGTLETYKGKVREFILKNLINEDTPKAKYYNRFTNDLITVMASTRFNSNKNIAEGCAYITTINKRTFMKMMCGALADLVASNRTLKVTKKAENK